MADDVERLKFEKRVADRLAAQTGPKPSKVHCWGCGKNQPWFTCDCARAVAWQEQRDKGRHDGHPRFNVKTNCIEGLDEETIRLNVALGYKRAAFGPPKSPKTRGLDRHENEPVEETQGIVIDAVPNFVTIDPLPVTKMPAEAQAVTKMGRRGRPSDRAAPASPAERAKAYREKRAQRKGGG